MAIRDALRPARPGAGTASAPAQAPAVARPATTQPPWWRLPLGTYLACQLILLAWWAAFYPALMTFDSASYVLHVTTGPWVNNHSVLYDSLIWLSLHATGGLAALTLAQTVAMAAALGYAAAAFRRLGVPGRWTAIAAVVVTLLPPTGMTAVFLWKDIPFSICAFLMVPTVAHLVSLRRDARLGSGRRVNGLIAALGLEMLGLVLFRINGFTVVALAAIVLVVLLRGARARIAAAAAGTIGVALLLSVVVYPAAGIKPTPPSLPYGPAYADIAVAYAAKPSSFTPADQQLLARVAPLSAWKKTANCYNSDPANGLALSHPQLGHQLLGLWLRVLSRTPQLIAGARICRGSVAWNIVQGPARLGGATAAPPDSVRPYIKAMLRHTGYSAAIGTRPLSWTLNKVARSLWKASQAAQLSWLLWRGALWCYLAYLILFAFARSRRNWALLAIGAVVAAQQLAIMATVPAQVFRYMIAPIVIGIMLVPLWFARKRAAPMSGGS